MIDALNQLLARLQRALVAEQRFTADASHELRSPLSAIQMRLQVLQRKYQHIPELDHDFERIQEDVSRSTKYWKIYCYSLAWNLMKQSN